MALQAAATLILAKFAAGQQLKSLSHLSKAFSFEAPAAARLTCSLRSDVRDLAQMCADAAKVAGLALATSALLAAARELGRQPTHLELFKRTKQSRKKDGSVDYARSHDQQIFDEYYKDMVEKYGDDPNTWPPVDEKLWMKAAHTPSQQHPKPRVYGYGGSRDTTGFFPERRGSSQSQTQSSAHPRFWDSPEFLDWIRERVTIMFQELQRSGSHGVPSFTAQSSRRQVLSDEDVGGEDVGSGREDVGSGSEDVGSGSESGGSGE